MRPKDTPLANELSQKLIQYQTTRPMPGIVPADNRQSFIEQILESIHRIEYVSAIRKRDIHPSRIDPASELFDPLKAALIHYRTGNIDEAFWLVFLSVQFGKHLKDGWRLTRDIYGGLGSQTWTWARTSGNPQAFQTWLASQQNILSADGISRRFGNHRRYETLKISQNNRGTAAAIKSYIGWIGANRGHQLLIDEAATATKHDPKAMFDYLYNSMNVDSFARLAKFDYLTMIGKLGLAPIEPGSPYLKGASGPLRGAILLFVENGIKPPSVKDLDQWVIELGDFLGVGMQVMEDSLCNWQKSPSQFVAFRG
ncbi:MAG: hypothetical protein KA155_08045 [Alphaproteobacteria bacterium]|nr:hypothetical protein [Alphaproteobacteria bacterium]